MSNKLNTFNAYLHTSDAARTCQTKWIGEFNCPMILNRLTKEDVP